MCDPALPPLDFLLEASLISLQDLELAALNRSANLGKAVKSDLEQWIEQCAAAMLARWMIENREALLSAGVAVNGKLEDVFEQTRRKKSA
jgi:hypothetical protein